MKNTFNFIVDWQLNSINNNDTLQKDFRFQSQESSQKESTGIYIQTEIQTNNPDTNKS